MQPEAIAALISGVIGGSLVAIVNHILTRKRTSAETKKLEAEAQKFTAEAEKIRSEMNHLNAALGEANYYDSTKVNEAVIYDGTKGFQGFDISPDFSEYRIQQGVLVIEDLGAGIILRKYVYAGKEFEYIPKNELISGYRKFHASCEVKVIEASYEFRIFLMENSETDESIDDRVIMVTNTEWTKTDFYFRAPPNKNYLARILVERISGYGSLQIKNLVLVERIN